MQLATEEGAEIYLRHLPAGIYLSFRPLMLVALQGDSSHAVTDSYFLFATFLAAAIMA
jgi:hypothetical protein